MSEFRHILNGAPRDALHWARHPKSVKAVEFLISGAKRDHRLRQIVREHIAEGGARIRCEAGRRYLLAVAESDASMQEVA